MIRVRPIQNADGPWVARRLRDAFGGVGVARGRDLCAFHCHGARRSREAKPSLPRLGADGIPMDHELEFKRRWSTSGSHATAPNFR